MAEAHFDFFVTLDKPRVLRANARSLRLFRDITGVDFCDADFGRETELQLSLEMLIGILFCMAKEMDSAADMKAIAASVTPETYPGLLEMIRPAQLGEPVSGSN